MITEKLKRIGISISFSRQYDKIINPKRLFQQFIRSIVNTMRQSVERGKKNNEETFQSKLPDLKAEIFSLV